jgi:hypothetical protein
MPRRSRDSRTEERPARVKLHGTVLILIQLENGRRVRGRVHQLSTSGGVLSLKSPLDEGILVEVMFHVGTTTIRNKAEMMFPLWATKGCLQPFQFVDLSDEQQSQLASEVRALLIPSASCTPEEACLDS